MESDTKEPAYIIIPVHNRKVITLQCLETLKTNGDLDRYHTVVVDDGSTDGTSEAIKSLYPDVILLHGDGNLWWTGAIKMGMEYAYEQGAEYFIWLNDDCLVECHLLEEIVQTIQSIPNSIIGAQGYESKNTNQLSFGGRNKIGLLEYKFIFCKEKEVLKCDLLSGNLVCLPRFIVTQLGYPNKKLLPHYGGDSEYLIRARRNGYTLFITNFQKARNIAETSNLSPKSWILEPGGALDVFKLLFQPQSCLHWHIYYMLSIAEYQNKLAPVIGILYYTKRFLIPVFIITVFRLFPLKLRSKMRLLKNALG